MARQRVVPQGSALRGTDEAASLSIWQRMEALLRAELPVVRGRGAASPATCKLILFVLVAFENQAKGRSWPGVKLIGSCAGLGDRSIHRAINQLVAGGLVEIVDRETGQPLGTTWSPHRAYRIDYGKLWDLVPSRDAGARDGAAATRNRASATRDRASAAAEQQTEQQREQSIEQLAHAPDSGELDLSWRQECRPALLQLGIDPSRVVELEVQCGSRERVIEILNMIRRSAHRIKNPAAYFARAAGRPDWRPTK